MVCLVNRSDRVIILHSSLINASLPGTIDESKIIKYFKDEKSKTEIKFVSHLKHASLYIHTLLNKFKSKGVMVRFF